MERQYKIYMDVCSLNRPFDDWTQARIRLEAEAILAIALRCQNQEWQLISSTALEAEISKTPDLSRRQRVMDSLIIAKPIIPVSEKILQRAKEIVPLGFKSFDALHMSCAEAAKVDIFLTTDDRLLRNAQRHESNLDVRVSNPVIWLMEISKAGDD
jgi:predicted nucleic acid-binding protein